MSETLFAWIDREIGDVFDRAADKIGSDEFDVSEISEESQAAIPMSLFAASLAMQDCWRDFIKDETDEIDFYDEPCTVARDRLRRAGAELADVARNLDPAVEAAIHAVEAAEREMSRYGDGPPFDPDELYAENV